MNGWDQDLNKKLIFIKNYSKCQVSKFPLSKCHHVNSWNWTVLIFPHCILYKIIYLEFSIFAMYQDLISECVEIYGHPYPRLIFQ